MNPKMDSQRMINLKVIALIFAAGMAWGSVLYGIKTIHLDLLNLNNRVSYIEQYLVPASKGRFIPDQRSYDSTNRRKGHEP